MIDFSWFYFVGRTRLCLTFKETGRLTLTMFNKLYSHYKNHWSMEMMLTRAGMSYEDMENKIREKEDWF